MSKSAATFKVVLPLDVGGESDKYPQKFSELGAEFVRQHCATDDEFIAFVIIRTNSVIAFSQKLK